MCVCMYVYTFTYNYTYINILLYTIILCDTYNISIAIYPAVRRSRAPSLEPPCSSGIRTMEFGSGRGNTVEFGG